MTEATETVESIIDAIGILQHRKEAADTAINQHKVRLDVLLRQAGRTEAKGTNAGARYQNTTSFVVNPTALVKLFTALELAYQVDVTKPFVEAARAAGIPIDDAVTTLSGVSLVVMRTANDALKRQIIDQEKAALEREVAELTAQFIATRAMVADTNV